VSLGTVCKPTSIPGRVSLVYFRFFWGLLCCVELCIFPRLFLTSCNVLTAWYSAKRNTFQNVLTNFSRKQNFIVVLKVPFQLFFLFSFLSTRNALTEFGIPKSVVPNTFKNFVTNISHNIILLKVPLNFNLLATSMTMPL